MQRHQRPTADCQNGYDEQQEKKNQPEHGMDRLQEGLQHDTTILVDRMPENIWCRGKHHQIPQERNAQLEDNSYKLWNHVSRGQHQKRDLPRRLTISTALHSSSDPNDKGPRENGGRVPTQERRQQN